MNSKRLKLVQAEPSKKTGVNWLVCDVCKAGCRSGICPEWVNTKTSVLCPKCKDQKPATTASLNIKLADAELKNILNSIMTSIDAGHMPPEAASSLKERMRDTLLHWLADHRDTQRTANYKAIIINKAMIRIATPKCDQCDSATINGVYSHEHGCPNRSKVFTDGEWITPEKDEE